jgi:hypothetical protein
MVRIGFELEVRPTFRDTRGRFARATEQLLEDKRDSVRTLGRRWMELTREEVRGGPSGTIGKQISYGTFGSGDTVGFRSRLGQIAKWHATGTGIHGPRGQVIRPRRAKALHFFIGGQEIYAKYVRGVTPDDFLQRGHDKWLPEARAELNRLATRFIARVSG